MLVIPIIYHTIKRKRVGNQIIIRITRTRLVGLKIKT